MLTIHRARAVRRVPGGEPAAGHAVAVDGDRIAAVGPYEELLDRYGGRARVREWAGEITPGRHEPDARAWLEAAYHPDPREADRLGTEPVTGEALTALGLTDSGWGASARRGLQRLLAAGTTSLTGPFTRPPVRTAVTRSGLRVLPPGAPAQPPPLAPGARADFAVFTVPGPSGAGTTGPGGIPGSGAFRPDMPGPDAPRPAAPGGEPAHCLATVIAGRLVHRRA